MDYYEPEPESTRKANDEPTERCRNCGEPLDNDELGDYCSEECEGSR